MSVDIYNGNNNNVTYNNKYNNKASFALGYNK